MNITAKATADYESVKAFIICLFRGKYKISLTLLVVNIFFAIALFSSALRFIADPAYFMVFLKALILTIVMNVLYFVMFHTILPHMQYNSLGELADLESRYQFYDTHFEEETLGSGLSAKHTMEYAYLVKIMETDKYLFLFQSKAIAYIVDKSTLEGNDNDILQETLKKLVPKYIRCKY